MTATTPQAIDQMSAVVVLGLAPWPELVVKWDGVDTLEPPSGDVDWVRVTISHDDGGQGSLSGDTGKRRWRRNGFILVQCFAQQVPEGTAPGDPVGKDKAMLYACAVRDAFQGRATDGGVWFRNCNAKEVGPDRSWYQANASITFDYDEVK